VHRWPDAARLPPDLENRLAPVRSLDEPCRSHSRRNASELQRGLPGGSLLPRTGRIQGALRGGERRQRILPAGQVELQACPRQQLVVHPQHQAGQTVRTQSSGLFNCTSGEFESNTSNTSTTATQRRSWGPPSCAYPATKAPPGVTVRRSLSAGRVAHNRKMRKLLRSSPQRRPRADITGASPAVPQARRAPCRSRRHEHGQACRGRLRHRTHPGRLRKSDETRDHRQSPVEQVRTVAARWLSAVAENNGNEVCALLSSEARQRVLLPPGRLTASITRRCRAPS